MAALTVGLLAAPSLTASAGAAVTHPVAHTVAPRTVTTPVCLTGMSNAYEFYTWCQGSSPAAYRTIAYCANGDAVLGVEYADGSGNLSYADCSATGGLNSTLSANWGILLCSDSDGAGTYAGYHDTSGDISGLMLNWGNGNITTGGTTLCDYSTGQATAVNPNTPPT
ncbi:MAG TPA: hypothetical protein VFN97_29055 [Actinospica sp.]|nr:hypothetical protein [Actinospica sp.]